jgi:hypothetical protein
VVNQKIESVGQTVCDKIIFTLPSKLTKKKIGKYSIRFSHNYAIQIASSLKKHKQLSSYLQHLMLKDYMRRNDFEKEALIEDMRFEKRNFEILKKGFEERIMLLQKRIQKLNQEEYHDNKTNAV